jgi:signal transduction histidine kinase
MTVIDAEPIEISEFLLKAVRASIGVARRRAIELRCLWEPSIGVVLVDAKRMHELLRTLVCHAIARTTPPGTVLVSAELLGDEVRFCITESTETSKGDDVDVGGPWPSDVGPAVEEPQWKPMEALVSAHGGRIWLDSDPEWGDMCCFTVLSSPRASA